MKGYVYILKSLKDNRQYIGSTLDVGRRVIEHNKGFVKSTKGRKPFVLKYVLEYESIKVAVQMEKRFKKSHQFLLKELKRQGLI